MVVACFADGFEACIPMTNSSGNDNPHEDFLRFVLHLMERLFCAEIGLEAEEL
jgi:hypothetical protein